MVASSWIEGLRRLTSKCLMTKMTILFGCWVSYLLFSGLAVGSESAPSFIDSSGNKIIVERPYHRIISLYGAHSENLFSLGLDKEVIGVSPHEAFPPQATRKPAFSYHDGVERFLAARPDLVLIRPMIARGYPNLVSKLKEAGVCVVSLQPRTVREMFSYWIKLGLLTGREQEARRMISKFKRGIEDIRHVVEDIPRSKRKRVYFESIHSRMKTFSPESIAIFALNTAGGINVASDAHARKGTNIAAYGKERILSHAGEIDVYLAQRGAMNNITLRQILEEPGFTGIKAVREGRVYIIDEKIVSRPTMRLLDGIYEIGRFLYPDVFNDVTIFKEVPRLSRAQFSEMVVKMLRIPLKTPSYRHDILGKRADIHRYGDFKDVDYSGREYKFIETAVARGLFPKVKKYEFRPYEALTREVLAYAILMAFDLPGTEDEAISDIDVHYPLYPYISTVVSAGIMGLGPQGRFHPKAPVSGQEAYQVLSSAIAQYCGGNKR